MPHHRLLTCATTDKSSTGHFTDRQDTSLLGVQRSPPSREHVLLAPRTRSPRPENTFSSPREHVLPTQENVFPTQEILFPCQENVFPNQENVVLLWSWLTQPSSMLIRN
ncbi:unnamed protein product [Arctogadus glacialis]